jgi:hypothetical protein
MAHHLRVDHVKKEPDDLKGGQKIDPSVRPPVPKKYEFFVREVARLLNPLDSNAEYDRLAKASAQPDRDDSQFQWASPELSQVMIWFDIRVFLKCSKLTVASLMTKGPVDVADFAKLVADKIRVERLRVAQRGRKLLY